MQMGCVDVEFDFAVDAKLLVYGDDGHGAGRSLAVTCDGAKHRRRGNS
jgi:hypothetical protein